MDTEEKTTGKNRIKRLFTILELFIFVSFVMLIFTYLEEQGRPLVNISWFTANTLVQNLLHSAEIIAGPVIVLQLVLFRFEYIKRLFTFLWKASMIYACLLFLRVGIAKI